MFRYFMEKRLKYFMEKRLSMNKNQAIHLRQRLAMVYAFVGWNCFILIFYKLVNKDKPETSNEQRSWYSKLAGAPDELYKYEVKGLTVIDEGFDVAYKAKLAQEKLESAEKRKKRFDMIAEN